MYCLYAFNGELMCFVHVLLNALDMKEKGEQAIIVVAPREGASMPDTLPFDPGRVVHIEMPFVDVSSTDLRARVRQGCVNARLDPTATALESLTAIKRAGADIILSYFTAELLDKELVPRR